MESMKGHVYCFVKRLLVGTSCIFCFMIVVPPAMLMLLFVVLPSLGINAPIFMWRPSEEAKWQLMAAIQGGALVIALLGFLVWTVRGKAAIAFASQRRRYLIVTFAYTLLLCYGLIAVGTTLFGPQYGRCDFYNAPTTLNAGRKDFNGVTYEIRVCGSAPRPQDGDDDQLELTVLDEHGEMLARRHYAVNWEAGISFHEPLQYEKDAVTAFNAFGEDIRIQIPPSRLDWIRARIPLLD